MTSKGDKLAKEFFDYDYTVGRTWDKPCDTISQALMQAQLNHKPGQIIMVHPEQQGILGGAIGAAAGNLIGIGGTERRGNESS